MSGTISYIWGFLCPRHTHSHNILCAWLSHAHVYVAMSCARILYTNTQSGIERSWYDFLINGRFSVGSSDRHNIGSHRCNLIYLVCYCTNEQGQSMGNPQLTFRVSSSTSFSEREGFKKKKKWDWGFWPWLGGEGSEGVLEAQPVIKSVLHALKG